MIRRTDRPHSRTPGSPSRPDRIPVIQSSPMRPAACLFPPSFSAAGAARSRRWYIQARNWLHGVLVGAGVASETTAAATEAVGVVRRDPMAMKPFAGYNFGDYWAHWINVGAKLKSPPQIFHVNWFRQNERGQVSVAGLRREPARAALDHRSMQGHRQGARHRHRPSAGAGRLGSQGPRDGAERDRGAADRRPARCGRTSSPASTNI